jgi:hypothetical protein
MTTEETERGDPFPRRSGAIDARALTNPAFTSSLIAISASAHLPGGPLPLPYAFLVGPFTLNELVRERMPKRRNKQMSTWARENPVARSELRSRVFSHADTTRRAIRFGLRHDVLALTSGGVMPGPGFEPQQSKGATDDATACWKAADLLGGWLLQSHGGPVTTLALLGLKP